MIFAKKKKSSSMAILIFIFVWVHFAFNQRQIQYNSFDRKTTKHIFEETALSSPWEKAMLETEELLSRHASKFSLPSCLIPDKSKTAALVKDALKRQRKVGPATRTSNDHPIQGSSLVPLPVLNMGMPKCGSSTLFEFFDCIGFATTHWQLNTNQFEGLCIRDAAIAGLPPLATCAKTKDALIQRNLDECFFPQLSLLEEIHEENSDATFVINFRPIRDWVTSVLGWKDMMDRFRDCDLPNLPKGQPAPSNSTNNSNNNNNNIEDEKDTRDTMMRFFCSHVLHLRNFVESHPSHALIELDLYDTEGSKDIMGALFPSAPGKQPSSQCWKHENKSADKIKKTSNSGVSNKSRKRRKRLKAKSIIKSWTSSGRT
jgi:hypothetical protein